MTSFRAAWCLLVGACLQAMLHGGEPPPRPTVIESGAAEMVSTEKETTFTFRDHVSVTGTNIKITCDELVVVARRSGDADALIGDQEQFKSLVAKGNVRIVQGDREATCEVASVYPGEDKVVLSGNPVVRSLKEGWAQTGPRMILYRGERRAVIEGTATERPRLTLPPLKDLGDLGNREAEKKADTADEKSGDAAKNAPAAPETPSMPPAGTAPAPRVTVPIPSPTK